MAAPLKKACKVTAQPFEISSEEQQAFESFDLPLPELAPEERVRRRLSFVSDGRFFWRNCSSSGKRIFSTFPQDVPFPVMSTEIWNGDSWDPFSYGAEFDLRRPFFEFLYDLWVKIPRPAVRIFKTTQSQAVQGVTESSQCYMGTSIHHSEAVFYSYSVYNSREVIDCLSVLGCENCYECVNVFNSSALRWCDHCTGCKESAFLLNCTDCEECYFCVGLTGKKFCIFNEQLSESDYRARLTEWDFTAKAVVELAKERFAEFLKGQRYEVGIDSNIGRSLIRCDRVYGGEKCLEGFESDRIKYSAQFVGINGEAKFIFNCVDCWGECSDLWYCSYCESCTNCFGCFGLRGKHYCLFNVQYSPEEYRSRLAIVKETLQRKKVWGKFFPALFSNYVYNHSHANDIKPLNKIQAGMLQYQWDDKEDDPKLGGLLAADPTRFSEVPEQLTDSLGDELCQGIFICEMSGRPYQITREELAGYRLMRVALPTRSSEQRHRERVTRLLRRGRG